jgi:Cyclin, N-terminal domain/Cyclin, C-terminal domain
MLKLTMNPRKHSKRHRIIPHRLRLPGGSNLLDRVEMECTDQRRIMFADNLRSLIKQESSGIYACTDYLRLCHWQDNVQQVVKKPKMEPYSTQPNLMSPNALIDEYCREQIVEWSFRVVDYFRIDREVVSVSLSFLDRFLATCRCDRTNFKLAATTTLYLAVKLLYPCKLADLGILSDLSRGEFDMNDVCRMERTILKTLSWNLHPPTSIAISSIYLDYFFASKVVTITSADLDDIYDVSSFFCELAVCDYFFVLFKQSTIALAAILNALEGMFGPENNLSNSIMRAASSEFNIGFGQDVAVARSRLWELYERSEECAQHTETTHFDEQQASWHGGIFVKKSSTVSSPVSVTKPCHTATEFNHTNHHDFPLRHESW